MTGLNNYRTTTGGTLIQALRHQLAMNQRPEANHAVRSSGPWKSSRASARASSCSSGRDWMRAVVASATSLLQPSDQLGIRSSWWAT
jgi:hypothetical protein